MFYSHSCFDSKGKGQGVSVQIEAMDGGRLRLTGDVEAVLALPANEVTDGFSFPFIPLTHV